MEIVNKEKIVKKGNLHIKNVICHFAQKKILKSIDIMVKKCYELVLHK